MTRRLEKAAPVPRVVSAPPTAARRPGAPAPDLRRLQRSHGNHFVQRLVRRPRVAALPLALGRADDPRERAADRAADAALHRETPRGSITPVPRRGAAVDPVPPALARDIARLRGGGRRLPTDLRVHMEGVYDAAFDQVRVHTGGAAHELSDAIGARAFTVGRDVFFRRGGYRPDTDSGRRLIAHELAHVLQHDGAGSTVLRSVLAKGKLNVVGEDHTESDERRTGEIAYSRENAGGGYWTEAQFTVEEGGQEPADRMDYRAVHSAALLIRNAERLPRVVKAVLEKKDAPALKALNECVSTLVEFAADLRRRRTRSGTELGRLVERVFDTADELADRYQLGVMGRASQQDPLGSDDLRVVGDLAADVEEKLGPMVKQLGDVLDVPPQQPGSGRDLAKYLRILRSTTMGEAANRTDRRGVWKVGDEHTRDLLRPGTGFVAKESVTIVRRAAFNDEFGSWYADRRSQLENLRADGGWITRFATRNGTLIGQRGLTARDGERVLLKARSIHDAGENPAFPEESRDLRHEAAEQLLAVREGFTDSEVRKALTKIADDLAPARSSSLLSRLLRRFSRRN